MALVLLIAGIVFLFGLIQWARSGALLWDIHILTKPGATNTAGANTAVTDAENGSTANAEESETLRKKEALQRAVRRMEMTMDGLLRSSLKVLGVLAFCVWLFVLVSVVVDALNLDWLDRLSFSANRILGNPTMRAGTARNRTGGASSSRNNTLRPLGSGVRR